MRERLQKYMASCGIASRRKCEKIILQGRVSINDKVVKELGIKVNADADRVTVDGKPIKTESTKVYIALNKPKGYLSTVEDDRGRKTIIDLTKEINERIYPIGRLDYDTSGLILLTNDGDVYNKIIHPREEKNKIYIALIKGIPDRNDIEQIRNGIDIDGYITSKAEFKIVQNYDGYCKVKIVIHEGRNRQIRKMCNKINHPVLELERIQIGKIKLGDLREGTWRFLTSKEINYLKMN